MKDRIMVRTIEELRQHFDTEKLYEHWMNGKLQTWLSDRHYNEQLEMINKVKNNGTNVITDLFKILDIAVDMEANVVQGEEIASKYEKNKILRQFTSDESILDNIDIVATNQFEMEELIKNERKTIYLLGDYFKLQRNIANIQFIGINEPVLQIDSNEVVDFVSKNIQIQNCIFDKEYEELLKNKKLDEKKKRKNQTYSVSILFDYLLSDDDRKKSEILYDAIKKNDFIENYDVNVVNKKMFSVLCSASIYQYFDVDMWGKSIKQKIQDLRLTDAFDEFMY